MKINTKTIVIVLVVGLVAFLMWKKSKGSGNGSSVDAVSDDPGSSVAGNTTKPTVVKITTKSSVGNTTKPTVVTVHTGSVAGNLDYILSHVNFTKTERVKILTLLDACEHSNMTRQSIEAKAHKRGYTFAQQLVLDAIWTLYTKDGEWIAGPNGKKNYGWELSKKVMKL